VAGDSPSNHVAINAAISFLGGARKLTVLPGSYGLSARIEIDQDNQIVDGVWRTAEFYKMAGYTHTTPMVEARLGTTGVGIIGLKLDGRDTGMGPAILVRGDHCSVIGNEVYNHGSNAAGFPVGNAIYLDGELASSGYIEGSIVTGNYVHDGLGCGTAQYHSKRAKICGNKYENLGLEGVTCDRTATEGTIIDGNHITNVCTAAGVGGIGLDGSCDVIVRSNHIDGTSVGSLSGVAAPGIGFQNNLGDTSNVQICGNTIKNAASYGIHCRTTGANAAGPGGTTVNVFIDGNICLDNAFGSVKADAGTTGTLGKNIYDGVPPDVPNTWPGREIAFKVHQSAALSGITGDFTAYVIPYNAEVIDKGGCIALGVFTAPRPGIYAFAAGCQVRDVAADHTDMELSIVPSAGAVFRAKERLGGAGSYGATVSALIELAAGATVHVAVRVGGGANGKQVDINSADSAYNYFWGRIVVETA
ncbi:MAG: right-handed parallel beta-helix repeat-containing protein, partial [Halothiobacillus sp.]|nr:right-handed parallel beta-helix repeat-containing protein [Halothiobacillus sp.]